LKAVAMGMVTAIALFCSNKPNPAITASLLKRLCTAVQRLTVVQLGLGLFTMCVNVDMPCGAAQLLVTRRVHYSLLVVIGEMREGAFDGSKQLPSDLTGTGVVITLFSKALLSGCDRKHRHMT
jgi:hypothetical protein